MDTYLRACRREVNQNPGNMPGLRQRLVGASLSEPHTSVTALQDACGHIPKILIEQTETKVTYNFKFAHMLKLFCAMEEDSSPCNSTPMNLLSAKDRLHLERDCSASAKENRKEGNQSRDRYKAG